MTMILPGTSNDVPPSVPPSILPGTSNDPSSFHHDHVPPQTKGRSSSSTESTRMPGEGSPPGCRSSSSNSPEEGGVADRGSRGPPPRTSSANQAHLLSSPGESSPSSSPGDSSSPENKLARDAVVNLLDFGSLRPIITSAISGRDCGRGRARRRCKHQRQDS